jgi:hypothetical protein
MWQREHEALNAASSRTRRTLVIPCYSQRSDRKDQAGQAVVCSSILRNSGFLRSRAGQRILRTLVVAGDVQASEVNGYVACVHLRIATFDTLQEHIEAAETVRLL